MRQIVTGRQTVRLESTGPTPSSIVEWLRADPPTALAGHAIDTVHDQAHDVVPQSSGALVLEAQGARITVHAINATAELQIYAEAWPANPTSTTNAHAERVAAHTQLTAMLNAITARVADPERAETRLRLMAEATAEDRTIEDRAAALFATEPQSISRQDALRLALRSIDLTTLSGDDTRGRVRALCAQARMPDPTNPSIGPVAAVCVYPSLVPVALELTKGSGVAVASVASAFPSGLSSLDVRLRDIADAVQAGADEIDVVLNRSAFLSGDHTRVAHELEAMRDQIGTRVMKVILETSELESPPLIRAAARLAIEARTDWIKTSTGKSSFGATPMAVLAMAQAIAERDTSEGKPIGLKISGGVRSASDALGYLSIVEATLGPAWLDPTRVRFGASGLLTNLVAEIAATNH